MYDRLRDALVAYAKTVKVGDRATPGCRSVPLTIDTVDRLVGLIADATKRGYRFALGGEPPGGPGYFLPVTIIDDPPEDARIVQEEQLPDFCRC